MRKKRVFLVALNWGLGHICRMIPVIREFQRQNFDVIVGVQGSQKAVLENELNNVVYLDFPHLNISLNGNRTQLFSLASQLPAFIFQIIREHRALKKVIKHYYPDVVISDNCYGLWNKQARCIFITHQVNICLPPSVSFLKKGINFLNQWFIRKFDECWIPDSYTLNIAGTLSKQKKNLNAKYIGILSRFSYQHQISKNEEHGEKILFILSGPEPQRSYFEKKITYELNLLGNEVSYLLIRGLPGKNRTIEDTRWLDFADTQMLEKLIPKAQFVLCRSGYSIIMDLLTLGKTALLIPTPGQTEQEYLAHYLSQKGWFITMEQNNFSLKDGLDQLAIHTANFRQIDLETNKKKLSSAIKNLATQIS